MPEVAENPNVVIAKSVQRLDDLIRLAGAVASDLKEQRYSFMQREAKVKTFEDQILARKQLLAELDEQIRLKKVQVAGSFNTFRDELERRQQALIKAEAEVSVARKNADEKARKADEMIAQAESILNKAEASQKARVKKAEEKAAA
jgi:hypothetical protein